MLRPLEFWGGPLRVALGLLSNRILSIGMERDSLLGWPWLAATKKKIVSGG